MNSQFVAFNSGKMDLTYLTKSKYDPSMDQLLGKETPVANLNDVRQGAVGHHPADRIIYRFKR